MTPITTRTYVPPESMATPSSKKAISTNQTSVKNVNQASIELLPTQTAPDVYPEPPLTPIASHDDRIHSAPANLQVEGDDEDGETRQATSSNVNISDEEKIQGLYSTNKNNKKPKAVHGNSRHSGANSRTPNKKTAVKSGDECK